jgi:carbamoyl-phosphate synthase large subunit
LYLQGWRNEKSRFTHCICIDNVLFIDKFLENATEAEAKAIADGNDAFMPAVMEHIEYAGVHSGDSACVILPVNISEKHLKTILYRRKRLNYVFLSRAMF